MIIIFLISFAVYLLTLFPGLAPYRDSGEMAAVIHTLGVAHPPGYPLYVLLGKVFCELLPFGSIAYRLNVLSAIAGSLTAVMLYLTFIELCKKHSYEILRFAQNDTLCNSAAPRNNNWSAKHISAAVALVAATSYLQWYLSLVSEMYTLNTFFAALLIYLAASYFSKQESKALALFSFIAGLSAGNRLDIVLLLAGLAPALFLFHIKKTGFNGVTTAAVLFILGFSVYLFLPLRSSVSPIFDWNHPATFERFISTIMRKTHGGTLDLLSTSYQSGANFNSGMLFYFKHLFGGFAYAGILLGIAGVYNIFKKNLWLAWGLTIAFIVSCPVFIYLSNMPPNTHSFAILEAHFLLPNVIFAVFVFFGLELLRKAQFVCYLLVGVNLFSNYGGLNKRTNFFNYDYSRNVFSSLPQDSIVVIKEDVQLFATWYRRFVQEKRADIAPVGQGLSGSEWYKNMMKISYPGISLNRLGSENNWLEMLENNPKRKLFFTPDIDPPGFTKLKVSPAGLTSQVSKTGAPDLSPVFLDEIMVFRGKYDYEGYKEFFTPDLIEDYAKTFYSEGFTLMQKGDNNGAEKRFYHTLMLKRIFPIAAFNIGYINFSAGKYEKALNYYLFAKGLYDETIKLAKEYNVLPDAANRFKDDAADVCLHLGVTKEKLGDDKEALRWYSESLLYRPAFPRAYYNMAVVYWKRKDWDNAIMEFENALRIDPGFNEARYFLDKAMQIKKGR